MTAPLPGGIASESCCQAEREASVDVTRCPGCRRPGKAVDRLTVKALLTSEALVRHGSAVYRFCETAHCTVVYFGECDVFETRDVSVAVFQKKPPGPRTVCYCFHVTEEDLRQEFATTGGSTAAFRIAALVKAGRCACELRNPQGSCCLGNIAKLSRELETSHVDSPTRGGSAVSESTA